mmetsp:Transcript_3561/g.2146  ORF Transcript_3561/g.2146 Transcript_3561/m.2146 type:complete len:107 (-) Transcript_3561:833-1153(-)
MISFFACIFFSHYQKPFSVKNSNRNHKITSYKVTCCDSRKFYLCHDISSFLKGFKYYKLNTSIVLSIRSATSSLFLKRLPLSRKILMTSEHSILAIIVTVKGRQPR